MLKTGKEPTQKARKKYEKEEDKKQFSGFITIGNL